MFTTHHVSHIRCHVSHVMCQVSRVRCHVSGVTCQVSQVMCHIFLFLFLFLTKLWGYFVEGLLSTGPIPSSIFLRGPPIYPKYKIPCSCNCLGFLIILEFDNKEGSSKTRRFILSIGALGRSEKEDFFYFFFLNIDTKIILIVNS